MQLRIVVIIVLVMFPGISFALPVKGFHEGPYIRLIGGGMSVTFDDNVNSGQKLGDDFEGVYGFQFGWHLWDSTAAELQARYNTKKIMNSREHTVVVNINIKYNFVTNALTKMDGLKILPFVSGGPTALIAAVPGDPSSSTGKLMGIYGAGIGGSTGIDFLVAKYLYFAAFGEADIHYLTTGYQTIGGVNTKMTSGGWQPTLSIMGAAGVHF